MKSKKPKVSFEEMKRTQEEFHELDLLDEIRNLLDNTVQVSGTIEYQRNQNNIADLLKEEEKFCFEYRLKKGDTRGVLFISYDHGMLLAGASGLNTKKEDCFFDKDIEDIRDGSLIVIMDKRNIRGVNNKYVAIGKEAAISALNKLEDVPSPNDFEEDPFWIGAPV